MVSKSRTDIYCKILAYKLRNYCYSATHNLQTQNSIHSKYDCLKFCGCEHATTCISIIIHKKAIIGVWILFNFVKCLSPFMKTNFLVSQKMNANNILELQQLKNVNIRRR